MYAETHATIQHQKFRTGDGSWKESPPYMSQGGDKIGVARRDLSVLVCHTTVRRNECLPHTSYSRRHRRFLVCDAVLVTNSATASRQSRSIRVFLAILALYFVQPCCRTQSQL
jgi:hypothetical protein